MVVLMMGNGSRITIKMIKAVTAAYLVTAVMLLLLSLLMYKFMISDIALSFGLVLTYILANITGGIIIGKSVNKRKFAWGILAGVIYVILFVIIGCLLGNSPFNVSIVLPAVLSVAGAMFGGIIS